MTAKSICMLLNETTTEINILYVGVTAYYLFSVFSVK